MTKPFNIERIQTALASANAAGKGGQLTADFESAVSRLVTAEKRLARIGASLVVLLAEIDDLDHDELRARLASLGDDAW